jgi:hypothetical protein
MRSRIPEVKALHSYWRENLKPRNWAIRSSSSQDRNSKRILTGTTKLAFSVKYVAELRVYCDVETRSKVESL